MQAHYDFDYYDPHTNNPSIVACVHIDHTHVSYNSFPNTRGIYFIGGMRIDRIMLLNSKMAAIPSYIKSDIDFRITATFKNTSNTQPQTLTLRLIDLKPMSIMQNNVQTFGFEFDSILTSPIIDRRNNIIPFIVGNANLQDHADHLPNQRR